MKFAKLVIALAAVVFAAVLAFMFVGWVISIFWYLVIFAALAGAAYVGYKFLAREPETKQIEAVKTPVVTVPRELKSAEKLLSEYKTKIESEK